ncbi:MAG: prepilin-type N-terminal cleavage/methylation domain-containing protein [Phycisphaerales bacterium]|nr:prepilin-type N-terminal cleavage/methylation domain-containing protein [Phycisphaerales bacterium]
MSTAKRRAFTLVELLVVVFVITVLAGLLFAALARARAGGRAAVCLSNLRQINIAYQTYVLDFGVNPLGDTENYENRLRFASGGVHWYGSAVETPGARLPASRPLNPYLADSQILRTEAPVFRCPSDNGYRSARTNTYLGLAVPELLTNTSGKGGSSLYYSFGSSYEINTWMYCQIGSLFGFGFSPPGTPKPYFRPRQGPHTVVVSPSRLALFGEYGSFLAGRLSPETRYDRDVPLAWWHGNEIAHVSMLDGASVVLKNTQSPTTQRYTVYLDPVAHRFGGTVLPESSSMFR